MPPMMRAMPTLPQVDRKTTASRLANAGRSHPRQPNGVTLQASQWSRRLLRAHRNDRYSDCLATDPHRCRCGATHLPARHLARTSSVPSVPQRPVARVAFELICRTSCLSDRNNGSVLPPSEVPGSPGWPEITGTSEHTHRRPRPG
jgi:hypothetical protein